MKSEPIHCWGKCQCHWCLAEQSMKTTDTHPKQNAVPFVLSRVEPKNIHNRLSRKALIWYIEVFTVVQYGNQMCIMYVHNHEWEDEFFFCFMNFLCLLGSSYLSLHHGKCRNWVLFQRVLWIMRISFFIWLHIHAITVPGGGPLSHNIFMI